MILPRHKKPQLTRHHYSSQPDTQRDENKENEQSCDETDKNLTAWEQWILKKAVEDRSRLEKEMADQQRKNEEVVKERCKKESRQQSALQKKQEWNKEYDAMFRQKTELAKQKRQSEQNVEKQKKQDALAKAEVKYHV